MLGSIEPKHAWEWTAMGKHPVATDYFQLGINEPLVNAFSGWIEDGYKKLIATKPDRATFHSWRFWSRGVRKGYIACGVGRDSSDSAGRPYPLLIMGIGILTGWEEHWDLLPLLFEKIWHQIESLFSGRFEDLRHLQDEISHITLPPADWPALADQRLNTGVPGNFSEERSLSRVLNGIERSAEELFTRNEVYVPINGDHGIDSLSLAVHWNGDLKSRAKIIPKAVFMGGIPEKSYLVIFNRSLNSSDFVRLWSLSSECQNEP